MAAALPVAQLVEEEGEGEEEQEEVPVRPRAPPRPRPPPPPRSRPPRRGSLEHMTPRQSTIQQLDAEQLAQVRQAQTRRVAPVKDAWMAKHVEDRAGDFVSFSSLSVQCCTWNVNAKVDSLENVARFIAPLDTPPGPQLPDVYAIGLQEVIELSAANVVGSSVLDVQSKEKSQAWLSQLSEAINALDPDVDFAALADVHLVGIFLAVFVRQDLLQDIYQVETGTVATGAGGVLGNKGGVIVRFNYQDSRICVVSSHLTANRGKVAQRNADFYNIATRPIFSDPALAPMQTSKTKKTVLGPGSRGPASSIFGTPGETLFWQQVSDMQQQCNLPTPAATPTPTPEAAGAAATATSVASPAMGSCPVGAPDAGQGATGAAAGLGFRNRERIRARLGQLDDIIADVGHRDRGTFSVIDHDIILWIGDLNYRLQEELDIDVAYNFIEMGADGYKALRALDQLNQERFADRVFNGFQEGVLTFPPTYKFIPGVGEYDRRPDKKVRCPSWCDRVLWRDREFVHRLRSQKLHSMATAAEESGGGAAAIAAVQGTADAFDVNAVLRASEASVVAGATTSGSGYSGWSTAGQGEYKQEHANSGDGGNEEGTDPAHTFGTVSLPETRESVRLDAYTNVEGPVISDHKPVCAALTARVKKVNPARKEEVLGELYQEWLKYESEHVPHACPSPKRLVVPDLVEDQNQTLTVTLANHRACESKFEFFAWSTPEWLTIEPVAGTLSPGDSIEVSLTVLAGMAYESARQMDGEVELWSTMVIRISGGDDVALPLLVLLRTLAQEQAMRRQQQLQLQDQQVAQATAPATNVGKAFFSPRGR